MLNATMIVPVGNFTPDVARRVCRTAVETAQRRAVVISMQWMARPSWSALYDLAEAIRADITPHRIRLTRALPHVRALFRELGIGSAWFVDDASPAERVLIAESKPD